MHTITRASFEAAFVALFLLRAHLKKFFLVAGIFGMNLKSYLEEHVVCSSESLDILS